jgi:hypothetical protein
MRRLLAFFAVAAAFCAAQPTYAQRFEHNGLSLASYSAMTRIDYMNPVCQMRVLNADGSPIDTSTLVASKPYCPIPNQTAD